MTRTKVLAAALALPLVLAACGGGDDDADSSGGDTPSTADLVVVGSDPARFDKAEYSLGSGLMTIELVNEGSLAHTLVIETAEGEDIDGFKISTAGGQTKDASVSLEPGTYALYCDIAGHRSQGMEAVLTVA